MKNNGRVKEIINAVRDAVHQNAIDHGWHDNPRDPGNTLMLCVGELSEAMEELRNHKRPDEVYHRKSNPGKPEGVPIELADCIIRILDYCGAENIDIGAAIALKHEYNINRPHRHGGKAY